MSGAVTPSCLTLPPSPCQIKSGPTLASNTLIAAGAANRNGPQIAVSVRTLLPHAEVPDVAPSLPFVTGARRLRPTLLLVGLQGPAVGPSLLLKGPPKALLPIRIPAGTPIRHAGRPSGHKTP